VSPAVAQGNMSHSPLRGVLWMALAAFFFAVSAALVRKIGFTINAFEQTFFRQLMGAVILLPFLWRVGLAGMRTGQLGTNIIRNIAGYAGISLSFYSVTLIPLAQSIALQFTLPLFTIILAMLLLGEHVGAHRWTAMVIGFAGALIILRPGFIEISLGMIVALAAAASFGVSDTLARKLARTDSTILIVFYSFAFQVPIALPGALYDWVTPSLADWPWLIALGLTSFAAQWGLSRAFVLAEASLVSPVLFLRLPIISVIGFVFFAEVPDIWTWIGAIIIFSATYYAARREAARHRQRRAMQAAK
jgi:drug/metabolite transporter (DMT)-like permease